MPNSITTAMPLIYFAVYQQLMGNLIAIAPINCKILIQQLSKFFTLYGIYRFLFLALKMKKYQ